MLVKSMKTKVFSLLIATGILLAFQTKIAEASFGISPPFLNANYLVKGAEYSQIVYLIQDQPISDLGIRANLEIPEKIKSWITVDKGYDFIIPQGVKQFPVEVKIKVPKDTDLGIYSGNISFTTKPAQAGQVTIALGAQLILNLRVGDEIYQNYNVPIIKPLDIEEGWNPKVLVRFNNMGNIPEAFTGATYELLDQYGAIRLAYIQKTSGFPEVPPFTEDEFIVEFPIDFYIGVGQYWANAAFYKGDVLVASQKTVFNALKAGSINGFLAQISNYFKKNQVTVGLSFLGLLMLIVIYRLIFGLRKNRK